MSGLTAASAFAGAGQDNLNMISDFVTSAMNIHEARQGRRFARNMANTEMQRRVRDLRAAGINPLMAVAGKGVGAASTPSTSAAHVDAPKMNSMDRMQLLLQSRLNEAQVNDLNSAAQLKNTQAGDISFMQKERLINLLAQTQSALSQSGLTNAQKEQLKVQADLIAGQLKKISVETATSALQLEKEKLMKKPYEIANKLLEGKPKKESAPFKKQPIRNDGSFPDWLRKKFHKFQSRRRGGASGTY